MHADARERPGVAAGARAEVVELTVGDVAGALGEIAVAVAGDALERDRRARPVAVGLPAGAEVDLLYATAGSAFSPITTVRAAADGTWATTLDLPQTGTIRARFPGDGARPAMESTSVRVKIVPLLDMTVSKTHLRRGRELAISGILWSRANEARVDVLIERKVRGRYQKVRLRHAKVTDHRYLRSLRPGTPGLYRITVSVPGARQRRYVHVTG